MQGYTSAVRWFAAGYLAGQPGRTSWEQVDAQDIQRWMTQLLHRYSGAYASIHPQPAGHRADRRPVRRVIRPDLGNHPDRALTQLRRVVR